MSWVLGRSSDYKVYWLHFSFLSYCIIFLTLYFRESICHTLVILLFVGCRGASIIPGSLRNWGLHEAALAWRLPLLLDSSKVPTTHVTQMQRKSQRQRQIQTCSWLEGLIKVESCTDIMLHTCIQCGQVSCLLTTVLYCSWENLSCLKNKGNIRTWSV